MSFYLICAYILAGVLGLCVGSFLNVVIYRLPGEMSLALPHSHCTSCGYYLKWYDNIPLISYFLLGGRCRKCRERISFRYVIVELLNMLLWLLSVRCFWEESPVKAVSAAIVCSCLICIFCIDAEYMLIYNRFINVIALCALVEIAFDANGAFDRVIGAFVGGGIFAVLYYFSLLALKKEGLGLGDVKLAASVGLLLGWQRFILAMLTASVVGSVVLITLNKISGKDKDTERPFGPFIVLGTGVGLFFGEAVIDWYINLLFSCFN